MNEITVKPGQTLLDIAIQHSGDATALFSIAQSNSLNITDELIGGQTLKIPKELNTKKVSYLKDRKIVPGYFDAAAKEGIDYWVIEEDFIVS